MTGVAGERGWLVSIEQVILSAKLLKSSSAEFTLWWAFTRKTNIFRFFCLFRAVYPHTLFPNFPCHQFSNHGPSKSLIIQPNHWPPSMKLCHRTSGHFSFQTKWTTRCTAPSSAHQEVFPSPLFFRDVPERCCSAAVIHFLVRSCRTICKPGWSLPFLCRPMVGNSPWGHGCRLEERRQCSRSADHWHLGHFFM